MWLRWRNATGPSRQSEDNTAIRRSVITSAKTYYVSRDFLVVDSFARYALCDVYRVVVYIPTAAEKSSFRNHSPVIS